MSRYKEVFRALAEASDALGNAIAYTGYYVPHDVNRVVIHFPDTRTLYRFMMDVRAGWDWMHSEKANTLEWKRDERGFVFADAVVSGIPWRFQSDERTLGYAISVGVDLGPLETTAEDTAYDTPLVTATFDPNTHYVAERSREPGVKRAG